MRHRPLVLVMGVVCLGAAAAFGCGGSTGTDLTTTGDGGAGDGSTLGADGSSGGSSGSTVPNNGPDGGVNPPNAGPGGNTTAVLCGATSCNIATEVCCVSRTNAGTSFGCVTGTTCPAAAGGGGGDVTALKCTGAANCPAGTVCCVDQTNTGTASSCQTACGNNQAQLCDPTAGDAGGCAPSQPCSSNNIGDWGLPRTFATCGGKGN